MPYARSAMAKVGSRIEENGSLAREGGQLFFRRAVGGRWRIEVLSPSGPATGCPGRLIGTVISEGTVTIERFTPDD